MITDSLDGVQATTRDGQRRLDDHFERGVDAKCWPRHAGNWKARAA